MSRFEASISLDKYVSMHINLDAIITLNFDNK